MIRVLSVICDQFAYEYRSYRDVRSERGSIVYEHGIMSNICDSFQSALYRSCWYLRYVWYVLSIYLVVIYAGIVCFRSLLIEQLSTVQYECI